MTYLLDTCTISDFVKGDVNTLSQLKKKSPTQIKVSSITVFELEYGLKKNPRIKAGIKEAISDFLDDIEVLPFGWGKLLKLPE